MEIRSKVKKIMILLSTILLMMAFFGCTRDATIGGGDIVEDTEITHILEEREMEIDTQSNEQETWINASDERMTLHYWANEEDSYYIEQSRQSSLRMAENMGGEVVEANGLTEIIIDWNTVGQGFYSVHLYKENRRIHIRLYDLNDLEEIRDLILQ